MSRVCVSDWMRLNCGDHVVEIDGRHVGRVEAIFNSAWVKVKWLDNGWISFVPLNDLVRIRDSDWR